MWNEGGNRLWSHQSIVCCTRCRLAKRWWGVGKPEEKYRIGLLPNFKETTHPFPGLRTGFVTAVGKTTLGEEAWEPLVQVQFPKYSGWNQHWYLFQIVWVGWCPAQQQQPWGQSWRRTWTTSPCSLWSSGWQKGHQLVLDKIQIYIQFKLFSTGVNTPCFLHIEITLKSLDFANYWCMICTFEHLNI